MGAASTAANLVPCDAEWRATAPLKASIIYQNHGRTDLSVARIRALKPLLTSPAIPASVRAQLASRVATK